MATFPTSSTTDGYDGTLNFTNETIGYPDTPTFNYLAEGSNNGMHLYRFKKEALEAFVRDNLWTEGFFDVLANNTYNPISGILNCYKLPYSPTVGESGFPLINGKAWSTGGQSVPYSVNALFTTINMGTVDIPACYDSFLDYAPYTAIKLFLPFIGLIEIPPELVVGGGIQVRYRFENTTGNCIAYVETTDRFGTTNMITSGTGNCLYQVPLTSLTNPTIYNTISTIGSIGLAAAGVAAGSLIGLGQQATAAGHSALMTTMAQGDLNSPQDRARAVHAASAARQQVVQGGQIAAQVGAFNALANGASNLGGALASTRSTAQVGAVSGNMGALNTLYPYVIITYPCVSYPENYNKYYGIPSNITSQLKQLTGFNSISGMRLDGIDNALDAEKAEIISLLSNGVIFPDSAR